MGKWNNLNKAKQQQQHGHAFATKRHATLPVRYKLLRWA